MPDSRSSAQARTASDGDSPRQISAGTPFGRVPRRPQSEVQRTEKVSEAVARSIAQDIAGRGLEPGTKLPPESAMLKRYRVGRASLREGLRILEIQGLITIRPGPGGGPVVAGANSGDFGRMSILHYQSLGATFRDLVDARQVIEPLMARAAAERRDPELIAVLEEISDQTSRGLETEHEYLTGSIGFHSTIAAASDNPILNLFGLSLQDVYAARVSQPVFPIDARRRVQDDHDEIIKAIKAGKATRAERLMREHMEQYAQFAAERFPGLLDEVVDWW